MNLAEWGKLILAEVTKEGSPERGLYFYVDQNVLAEISGLPSSEEALTDFCNAYTLTMPPSDPLGYYYKPYATFKNLGFESWQFYEFVAALAMTVLAITENDSPSPNQVFRRQRELMRLPGAAMPPGYDDYIGLFWRCWNQWLKNEGSAFGKPVIETVQSQWTNIGWPKAQGIIRRPYRDLIRQWIQDRELQGQSNLNSAVAFNRFLSWLETSGARGERLRDLVTDKSALEILESVFEDELKFPGASTGGPTTRRVAARIVLNPLDELFHLEISEDSLTKIDQHCDECNITITQHDRSNVVKKQSGFSCQINLANPDKLLAKGLKATLSFDTVPNLRASITAGGKDYYLLDATQRTWSETTTSRIGDEFAILCNAQQLPTSIKYATDVSGGVPEVSALSSVSGWHVIGPFEFQTVPSVEGSWLPRPLEPLVLSLRGGLRLGNTNTFLADCLPDFEYPASENGVITIDGITHLTEPGGGTLHLEHLEIGPGEHVISMGNASKRFAIREYVNRTPVASSIGHTIRTVNRKSQLDIEASDISQEKYAVQGFFSKGFTTRLPESPLQPQFRKYYAITSDARIFEIPSILPNWAQALGINCSPRTLDLDALCSNLPRKSILLAQLKHTFEMGEPKFVLVDLRRYMERYRGLNSTKLNLPERPGILNSLSLNDFHLPSSVDPERFEALLNGIRERSAVSVQEPQRHAKSAPIARLGQTVTTFATNEDVLLDWLSESPTGFVSRDRFDDAVAWINKCYPTRNPIHKESILSRLTALGFVEVDYSSRKIGIAPPTITFPRNSGSLALLTGSRPRNFIKRLTDPDPSLPGIDNIFPELVVMKNPSGQIIGPTLTFLHWDPRESESINHLLDTLDIKIADNTTDIIIRSWPTLDETLQEALTLTEPPSTNMQRAESNQLSVRWLPTSDDFAPGLYRYDTFGPKVYAWVTGSGATSIRRKVTRETGHFLHARDWQIRFWQKASLLNYSESNRALEVPWTLAFPPLLERALVAHSGLAPVRERRNHSYLGQTDILTYLNVDLDVCLEIASRLGQTINRLV